MIHHTFSAIRTPSTVTLVVLFLAVCRTMATSGGGAQVQSNNVLQQAALPTSGCSCCKLFVLVCNAKYERYRLYDVYVYLSLTPPLHRERREISLMDRVIQKHHPAA